MIIISLGSNLGNRFDNLRQAVNLIDQRCLRNIQYSIILETTAILPNYARTDWNKPFLNMIVGGETHLSPKELLNELKNIEREMGRPVEYEKWSPRIIDLDIVLYNDLVVDTIDLTIPHSEIKNRSFLKHLLSLMQPKSWISEHLENSFIKSYLLQPELVGVINITKDSFSDGGEFYDPIKAVEQILRLDEEGVSFIEIGAQSTRPGALIQSIEDEYIKIEEVLSRISHYNRKLKISVDTFHPSIALKLIRKFNVSMINDVKCDFDEDSLRVIANSGCKFCLMHSITIPPNKSNVIPQSIDTLEYLITWGENSLKRLKNLGFSKENIILDPGIGFGKTTYQNIEILRNIDKFKDLGCKIMVGHSRKSYIQAFSKELNAYNLDIETIIISLAIADKVDFLRIHNVRDHRKALVAHYLFQRGA